MWMHHSGPENVYDRVSEQFLPDNPEGATDVSPVTEEEVTSQTSIRRVIITLSIHTPARMTRFVMHQQQLLKLLTWFA
jgi:hypothetical protein